MKRKLMSALMVCLLALSFMVPVAVAAEWRVVSLLFPEWFRVGVLKDWGCNVQVKLVTTMFLLTRPVKIIIPRGIQWRLLPEVLLV